MLLYYYVLTLFDQINESESESEHSANVGLMLGQRWEYRSMLVAIAIIGHLSIGVTLAQRLIPIVVSFRILLCRSNVGPTPFNQGEVPAFLICQTNVGPTSLNQPRPLRSPADVGPTVACYLGYKLQS